MAANRIMKDSRDTVIENKQIHPRFDCSYSMDQYVSVMKSVSNVVPRYDDEDRKSAPDVHLPYFDEDYNYDYETRSNISNLAITRSDLNALKNQARSIEDGIDDNNMLMEVKAAFELYLDTCRTIISRSAVVAANTVLDPLRIALKHKTRASTLARIHRRSSGLGQRRRRSSASVFSGSQQEQSTSSDSEDVPDRSDTRSRSSGSDTNNRSIS